MKKDKKTIQRSIRLKDSVIKKIEILAKEENRTFNNMVETILLKHLTS